MLSSYQYLKIIFIVFEVLFRHLFYFSIWAFIKFKVLNRTLNLINAPLYEFILFFHLIFLFLSNLKFDFFIFIEFEV